MNIKNKKDCCGCTACISICKHHAVLIETDKFGFVFPKTDYTKCVKCGLCEKVCPIKIDLTNSEPISSNIAIALDKKEQLTSTSGGIASVLARFFISKLKGVVYGCTGEDCFNVRHIRIEHEDEISLLKGSKYVQSNMLDIYPRIKEDLQDKREVLFIGTPCQVAGLRCFLLKEYNNLYCVDFVCHGVPSQQLLNDAINGLKIDDSLKSVNFRYKDKKGKSQYCLQLINDKKQIVYTGKYGHDKYITGFLLGLFYRDSCYSCKFATSKRVSDITLGDFWDQDYTYSKIFKTRNGLSQLNINTTKGERLVNKIHHLIEKSPINIKKLLDHSPQLSKPMNKYKTFNLFFDNYQKQGFNMACAISLKDFFKYYRRKRVTKYLYRIPFVYKIIQQLKK